MNTTTKTQSHFDDGRYELMNGNMARFLTNKNIETFANENNVWR